MKLDHDLVRKILLVIESSDSLQGPDENELLKKIPSTYDRNRIAYSISKLKEANYITGRVVWGNNVAAIIEPGNLTYEGHQFLDNIRDDGVWKHTKNILSKFSSVSLTLVSKISAEVITQLIEKQMGI